MHTTIDHEAGMRMPLAKNDILVLLVDDQPMIGEAVRRILEDQPNVNFHFCSDPNDALLVAGKVKPTVILQDLVMPGVDGLTLVKQYRSNPVTRDIPVIVLSTKEDPTIKSEAFAAGANDYLVKLPDSIELIARVRYHSKAYLNQIQRDQAYRALRNSQRQLQEKNLVLQRLSNQDGLTGLSNRRYFDEYIESQWKLAIREKNPISILMIDVDCFKQYNDTYGHLKGDDVLKNIASVMQKRFLRPTDLTARFGGEEFVVVMPATPLAPLHALGESLRQAVEELSILHTASTVGEYITVSVGGASMLPQPSDSFLMLIDLADESLYEAKKMGKNRVVTHEEIHHFSPPGHGGTAAAA